MEETKKAEEFFIDSKLTVVLALLLYDSSDVCTFREAVRSFLCFIGPMVHLAPYFPIFSLIHAYFPIFLLIQNKDVLVSAVLADHRSGILQRVVHYDILNQPDIHFKNCFRRVDGAKPVRRGGTAQLEKLHPQA